MMKVGLAVKEEIGVSIMDNKMVCTEIFGENCLGGRWSLCGQVNVHGAKAVAFFPTDGDERILNCITRTVCFTDPFHSHPNSASKDNGNSLFKATVVLYCKMLVFINDNSEICLRNILQGLLEVGDIAVVSRMEIVLIDHVLGITPGASLVEEAESH